VPIEKYGSVDAGDSVQCFQGLLLRAERQPSPSPTPQVPLTVSLRAISGPERNMNPIYVRDTEDKELYILRNVLG
jgi:hypothetical protein